MVCEPLLMVPPSNSQEAWVRTASVRTDLLQTAETVPQQDLELNETRYSRCLSGDGKAPSADPGLIRSGSIFL